MSSQLRTTCFFIALLSATSCAADKDEVADGSTADVDSEDAADSDVTPCIDLDEEACDALRPQCESVFGGRTSGDGSVVYEYAGCWTGTGCAGASGCSRSPHSGVCYVFPDYCIPDGWVIIERCASEPGCPQR